MTTIYDTNVLVQVVPNLKLAQNFLLDKFFPYAVEESSEFVSIDVDVGKRRIAPFCSPLVEGKIVEARRVQTNTFKPAYIKDKRAPDLRRPIRRMIGERIGGDMTAAEREEANLTLEMADQVDMIQRRLEWMAAQALQTGTVTITGEGYPTTIVDFGRDSALTVALSGGSRWGQSGVVPSDDIETWITLILKKSGAVVTDIVFTTASWAKFKNDPRISQTIWFAGNGGAGNVVEVGAKVERGAVWKGKWGNYDLWLYNDWYVDDNNVEQPMLTDGTVILCGPDMMGTRAFGAILDPAFNYGPMAFAPKSWLQQDPAQRYLMMQSAPIVIPSRVNACLAATVV